MCFSVAIILVPCRTRKAEALSAQGSGEREATRRGPGDCSSSINPRRRAKTARAFVHPEWTDLTGEWSQLTMSGYNDIRTHPPIHTQNSLFFQ